MRGKIVVSVAAGNNPKSLLLRFDVLENSQLLQNFQGLKSLQSEDTRIASLNESESRNLLDNLRKTIDEIW